MSSEQEKRDSFIKEIESYIRVMSEADVNRETFMLLLSSLIFTSNMYLMKEVEIEELQNICYDIEDFLGSLEEISKDDFNQMFNGNE